MRLMPILWAALAYSAATVPGAAGAEVNAGAMALELGDNGGLQRLSVDGETWYVDSPEPTLWELTFRDADGETHTAASETAGATVESEGDTTRWRGVPLGHGETCDVSVTWTPRDDGVEGRIAVDNRSERMILTQVDFPVITLRPKPSPAEQTTLVFSRAFGRSWRDPFRGPAGYLVGAMEPHGLETPGPVQFGTLYDDAGRGLYWATHDGDAYGKRFFYTNDPAAETIRLRMRHYPSGLDQPGNDYALPYPVVLSAYRGDWWDAAMTYRRWALQQKWAASGPLRTRTDVPEWAKRTHVWARGNSEIPSEPHEACLAGYAELFGTPLAVHWYNWHEGKLWSDPAVWPPRPGVAEEMRRLREQGVYALPYINSLMFDSQSAAYSEAAAAGRLIDEEGRPVVWNADYYPTGYEMCAGSPAWQQRLVDFSVRLVRELRSGGVYLDQLGHQVLAQCFDPTHGHPIGGGHYGADGIRSMLRSVRDAMREIDPEAISVGESHAETFLDLADVRLNHYNVWPGWVNLWAAVYGDHGLTYGRTIALVGPLADEGAGFAARIANTLNAGAAFGRVWVSGGKNTWDNPGHAEKLQFLQRMIAFREAFAEYIVLGHYQRPIRFTTPIPEVSLLDAKQRPMTMPAIVSSGWVNAESELALLFINVSDEPLTFGFQRDLTRDEVTQAPRYRVQRATPEGREAWGETGPQLERELTLGRWEAVVVEVTAG